MEAGNYLTTQNTHTFKPYRKSPVNGSNLVVDCQIRVRAGTSKRKNLGQLGRGLCPNGYPNNGAIEGKWK